MGVGKFFIGPWYLLVCCFGEVMHMAVWLDLSFSHKLYYGGRVVF